VADESAAQDAVQVALTHSGVWTSSSITPASAILRRSSN
jgi:hypothetical protein